MADPNDDAVRLFPHKLVGTGAAGKLGLVGEDAMGTFHVKRSDARREVRKEFIMDDYNEFRPHE